MKYTSATFDMADDMQNVLHTAIETIYPKYYPKEVVDFFCRHHSKEHIGFHQNLSSILSRTISD